MFGNIKSFLAKMLGIDSLAFKGKFTMQHIRDGQVIGEYEIPNGVTNSAKDTALDILFYTASKISNWYCGLISGASYSGVAAADTMASHAGWLEFTGYSQANRVAWGTGAPSSQVVTNSSAMTFSINASGTLKGIFIASNNTKSGTTGTLWSTALFAADLSVNSGDSLNFTYTVNVS